jgi:hypothetical protein
LESKDVIIVRQWPKVQGVARGKIDLTVGGFAA